jgi:hypothetical protein
MSKTEGGQPGAERGGDLKAGQNGKSEGEDQVAAVLEKRSTDAPAAEFRLLLVSLLASGIGLLAGGVAFVLYKLIGLFTNLLLSSFRC